MKPLRDRNDSGLNRFSTPELFEPRHSVFYTSKIIGVEVPKNERMECGPMQFFSIFQMLLMAHQAIAYKQSPGGMREVLKCETYQIIKNGIFKTHFKLYIGR